jgi:hypothetical protein
MPSRRQSNMLFLKAFVVGFAITLGLEVALGLSHALRVVMRGKKK